MKRTINKRSRIYFTNKKDYDKSLKKYRAWEKKHDEKSNRLDKKKDMPSPSV